MTAWLPNDAQERADYLSDLACSHVVGLAGAVILDRFAAVMATRDLEVSDWIVLWQLRRMETRQTAGVLAARTRLRASTLSTSLKRLSGRGLITRARVDADQRSVNVALTDSGRACFDELMPRMRDADARCLAGLTPDERETLLRILRTLLMSLPAESR
jgi:DNA-binding MarR family transcriptional regulator